MKDILIGTGDEYLDDFLKKDIEHNEIGKVQRIVSTRKHLVKSVNEFAPDMIIVGEDLIGEGSEEESDQEWEAVIEEIRRLSFDLRIVFYCERKEDDIFLTKLTTLNVTDIFNEGKLPAGYLNQLTSGPDYKNIERFRHKVKNVQEELQKEKEVQQEREAEDIMMKGRMPKFGSVLSNQAPVYEQLMIRPKLIVFASSYEGAGSSSMARLFAEYLTNLNLSVGVLESPYSKPYWFDSLNALSQISENWKSWHSLINEGYEVSEGSDLVIDDVTYLVKHPDDKIKDWNIMKSAYLIGYARQIPLLIYDMSHSFNQDEEKLILKQANHIVFTSGYDPVRINRNIGYFDEYFDESIVDKMTLVLNHSTDVLKKKYAKEVAQTYGFQDAKFSIPIPHIEGMTLSMVEGKSPWSILEDDQKEILEEEMGSIAIDLLGEELFEKLQPKKKKGFKLPFMKKQ
ncbi:hypothetical protein GLW08_20435 [Pontibacillus yanchengensis]|uniref:Uncharacterized protein n=2 Tax=Pontibacillus yanchengensis TaxID=462910 RepID=A0ACC7VL14_9BACI|nr:hypothetical protein [Pontibacillus yanchengensis]MYL35473.1 hypothetical protein [Pontibacillus yanchengensis]MYL55673.1 hypothetical protein [Pontibacillus yanchengensis]